MNQQIKFQLKDGFNLLLSPQQLLQLYSGVLLLIMLEIVYNALIPQLLVVHIPMVPDTSYHPQRPVS
jgi:hypothetical protein